jgi:hypothetical protein
MATADDNKTVDISLECDPELNYLPWRVSVENFAVRVRVRVQQSVMNHL